MGREKGGVGREMGGVEREMGGVGREMGGVGREMGGVGREMCGVGREMGGVEREMGGVGREMGGVEREMGGEDGREMGVYDCSCLSPTYRRGTLLGTAIFFYATTSPVNGYFGGALYSRLRGIYMCVPPTFQGS